MNLGCLGTQIFIPDGTFRLAQLGSRWISIYGVAFEFTLALGLEVVSWSPRRFTRIWLNDVRLNWCTSWCKPVAKIRPKPDNHSMTSKIAIQQAQAEAQFSAEERAGVMPRTMSMSTAGLKRLEARQRKDAQEVASSIRSPRSLCMFMADQVRDLTLTQNPSSEFNREGVGWSTD